MGMAMELFAVRELTMQRLLADPPLIWQLIAPDEPEMYEEARSEAQRNELGFLSRLFGRKAVGAKATYVPPLQLAEGEGPVADLDKAWHGLHFLLTGAADGGNTPLDFLVVGGDDVGTVDVGYGPARVLRPALVAEIALKLVALPDAELQSRFDGAAMSTEKIYPDIWERDPADDDTLGYLMENLVGLRKAVADAAAMGHGLVIILH